MDKITQTDCQANDVELVNKLIKKQVHYNDINKAVDFLKLISDPTRMKIILLLEDGEVGVNDLAVAMDMTKSAISHQLKALKVGGYIQDRRDGKRKFYSISDQHIMTIIQSTFDHVRHCNT